MKDVIIFDLDGTLALIDHRLHFIEDKKNQDWDAFYEACLEDLPNYTVIDMYKRLENDFFMMIMTGRSDQVRGKTDVWLKEQDIHIAPNRLIMRRAGDFTSDNELKKKWVEKIGTSRIHLVFDDRTRVCEMWRSMGIPCFQVASGDF